MKDNNRHSVSIAKGCIVCCFNDYPTHDWDENKVFHRTNFTRRYNKAWNKQEKSLFFFNASQSIYLLDQVRPDVQPCYIADIFKHAFKFYKADIA